MRTLTDQVLTILRTGGHPVGDGDGEGLTPPFRVLYPLIQTRDGSLADSWSDVDKAFQVTCEAESREQAEWLADLTDTQLLAADAQVSLLTRPEPWRDDTTGQPPRWKAQPRYLIQTYI